MQLVLLFKWYTHVYDVLQYQARLYCILEGTIYIGLIYNTVVIGSTKTIMKNIFYTVVCWP